MTGRMFVHPAFDYLIIGGGLSLMATAFIARGDALPGAISAAFPLILFLVNLTHFSSSTVRLYTKSRALEEHPFLTAGLPLVTLGLLSVAIALAERVGGHVMRLYLTWSPYHYSAQAYGLAVMYGYRSGTFMDDVDKRLLRLACVAPFLYAFFRGPDAGIGWILPWQVLAEAHVALVREFLMLAAGAAAVVLPPYVYLRSLRRGRALPLISLLVVVSNAAWWLVLLYMNAFGWATVFHGLQYLAIVTVFHVREQLRAPANEHGWLYHAATFYLASAALAYLLFQAWPYAFVLLGFGPVESVLLVVATINIHHFIVDAYIWRLRKDRNFGTVTDGLPEGLASAAA